MSELYHGARVFAITPENEIKTGTAYELHDNDIVIWDDCSYGRGYEYMDDYRNAVNIHLLPRVEPRYTELSTIEGTNVTNFVSDAHDRLSPEEWEVVKSDILFYFQSLDSHAARLQKDGE